MAASAAPAPLVVRHLGRRRYPAVFDAMKAFTLSRTVATPDEIWLVEHPPVFTLGMNGKPEHLLAPGDIPVIAVDRGGQVTYHGPGQAVFYCLLDLRRAGLGVRQVVSSLEHSVIAFLESLGIRAEARADAPGVYVERRKIASLGLRVRRGCCYHGLSFNVDMDLEPFQRINPCGYVGLEVTQLSELVATPNPEWCKKAVLHNLIKLLGYLEIRETNNLPQPATPGVDHARTENTS